MSMSARKCAFVVGLIALFAAGLVLPAHAYTKVYQIQNLTGLTQSSIRATTNGLENITRSATGCCASGWGAATPGYALVSGVFCTTVNYAGRAVGPNTFVWIAWKTADGSCRLRDLRWGSGHAVVPMSETGVPGGGMVFYDDPVPGCLTVVITNDTDEVIDLSEVEFAISGEELSLETLYDLMQTGLVELRVANIDADIDVLRAEVEDAGAAGDLPSPSANSLIRKLGRAVDYKHDGLDEYVAGDLDGALTFWAKAAKQIENFVSEVTAASQKGNLGLDLYNRWIVDGGGEIATAPEIQAALLALPEGQSLQSLPPLPEETPLPSSSGLDPNDRVQWPVESLEPGQYTAFVICGGDEEAAVIMGGSVLDEGGNTVLEWMEQSSPEPLDTQPPVIETATATPRNLWPPDHSMVEIALEVTVKDDGYAIWYVADVSSNQPVTGTGDGDTAPDWWIDPDDLQSLWLRAERSGNHPTEMREYTITLMAIDTGGNLSDPADPACKLRVPVNHDQG